MESKRENGIEPSGVASVPVSNPLSEHLPGRRHAGLPQLQGLQGVRRGKPAGGLECLGDVCHLAGTADADRAAEADDYKVVPTSR